MGLLRVSPSSILWLLNVRRAASSSKLNGMLTSKDVPRPITWGICKSNPHSFYFLAEFHEMEDKLPELQEFCAVTADIHQRSAGKSPDGQFGFHVTTRTSLPGITSWGTC